MMLLERRDHIRVIDLYSVKPLDLTTLRSAARETGAIITVEDHYAEGGLGDAVLSALAGESAKFRKLAITEIPRSGKADQLLDAFGISVPRLRWSAARTFSSTVMCGNTAEIWDERTMPRRAVCAGFSCVMSSPW